MVRSMMSRASLPITFWGYALETVAHILNRVPTKKVSKTLSKCGTGKFPHSSTSRSGVVRHSLNAIPRTNLNPDPKDVGLSVTHKIALDIYFSDPLKSGVCSSKMNVP